MNKKDKRKNDNAWELLFDKYDILSHIEKDGKYIISSGKIKEFREPRLMAKFDHSINLPHIFAENNLSILPISRGDYIISNFRTYQPFESLDSTIFRASLPANLQSLDPNNIQSETMAINCAFASGILYDFLGEETLYPTVSGRMKSGHFQFGIQNIAANKEVEIDVNNSQIEIDAAFEGINSLALIEAKRDLADDFLIRQLYYPFRTWNNRITKRVRPVFLVYSNGIFNLYEYDFRDPGSYNSLVLIKHKNYSIEDTEIELSDLQDLAKSVTIVPEPEVSFPQANRFERVINLCELLNSQEMDRDQVTEEYAFDIRQANYYTDAARYLGLLEKRHGNGRKPVYSLSTQGKHIMNMNYKQRQLEFCKAILQHRVFNEVFSLCMTVGSLPDADMIVSIMKKCDLYNVGSMNTYIRRSSTIGGWLNWMLGLISE